MVGIQKNEEHLARERRRKTRGRAQRLLLPAVKTISRQRAPVAGTSRCRGPRGRGDSGEGRQRGDGAAKWRGGGRGGRVWQRGKGLAEGEGVFKGERTVQTRDINKLTQRLAEQGCESSPQPSLAEPPPIVFLPIFLVLSTAPMNRMPPLWTGLGSAKARPMLQPLQPTGAELFHPSENDRM